MNPRYHGDMSKVAAARINDVAFALYCDLSAGGNLIFSPLGVYCVLRMLLYGAQGETRQVLSLLLQENSETDAPSPLRVLLDLLDSYTRLTVTEVDSIEHASEARRRLEQSGEWGEHHAILYGTASEDDLRLQLSIANAIWIQEGYECKPGFRDAIHAMMAADPTVLDFKGRRAESCDAINAWVSEQTHGRIGAMLSPESVSPLTRAILGNALYFKARWQQEFHKSKMGNFTLLDGAKIQVQMMEGEFWRLKHVHRSDFWAVELPYYGRPISMVLIVPTLPGKDALVRFEHQLSDRWSEISDGEQEWEAVTLTMPQFKVRGSHRLSDTLSGLGLDVVFLPEADFSGISEEPGFRIDDILHDAYLAVDQHGTEAAAVTLAAMEGAMRPLQRTALVIDRPFLFAVVDKNSGVILFIGKVENPE